MPPEKSKALVQTLKKIPIFKGLAPSQIQKVLGACEMKLFKPGDIVCARGTMSDDMQVLISGELGVMSDDGICLAVLTPITTVGEMGMITRQQRSAQVEALQTSQALVIARRPFEMLLNSDVDFKLQVYLNVVGSLSGKIVNDNVRLRDHLLERVESEKAIHALRKQLDFALDIIEQSAEMSRSEAQTQIDEKMIDDALRILIVDDEEPVRDYVKKALVDCEVVEAADGQEALIVIEMAKPNLVITDIHMPNMDGFELAKEIGEKYPDLPVIALSGMIASEDIAGHNFSSFIDKPMRIEDFREAIEEALSKEE
ncbi:MAG: CheY-like chemotaxis protein [Planctomycetota bacterium]|jgi:CheY-like chemotaxis protein